MKLSSVSFRLVPLSLPFIFFLSIVLVAESAINVFANESIAGDSKYEGKAVYLFAEFHENEGCPTNSNCDRESGSFRKKWLELSYNLIKKKGSSTEGQLEKFRQKYGIPVGHWIRREALTSQFIPISWDTPCSHHQLPKAPSKFLLGETFIKDTKGGKIQAFQKGIPLTLPLTEGALLLDPIVIIEVGGNTKKEPAKILFYVPQGEFPLYVEDKKLHLVRDAEGSYYSLLISSDGSWKIVSAPVKGELPTSVNCPDFLAKHFHEELNKFKIYSGYSCRQITDRKTKATFLMLAPGSC